MEKERLDWIDNAKLITMLLVIIGHSNYYSLLTLYGGIDYMSELTNKPLAYKILQMLVGFIYTFHMPLFIALSGMCFALTQAENLSLSNLVQKKAKRLLIPFIVVTLLIDIPLKMVGGYWQGSDDMLRDVIYGQILLMGSSHLWFLASLFWIFIIFFAILKINIHRYLKWIILLIFHVIGSYIPINFMGIPFAIKYIIYFAIGYRCLEFLNAKSSIKNPLLLLTACFFAYNLQFIFYKMCDFPILEQVSRICMGFALAIFGILAISEISKRVNLNYMGGVKNNTFELYLYSDPINYPIIALLYILLGNEMLANSHTVLFMFLIRGIIQILFSFVIIFLVKKFRLKNIAHVFKYKNDTLHVTG